MNDLKSSAARGIMWAYASKYSGKLLVFISTIILARLLVQEDFGVAGYALVVIAFLETLSGLGIGPALIYTKDDPAARDSGFFLGLTAALSLLLLTWIGAPMIAGFFQDPRAADVSRVLALTLPISALGNVQFALLEKNLEFGKKFVPDLANAVCKGLASILFALLDFGVWSLIYGQLAGTIAGVVAVWIIMPWRPSLRFDTTIAASLLAFGSKIVAVGILGFLVTNVGFFLIGRFSSAAMLGIYVLALRIPNVMIKESAVVLNQVLFPVFTKLKKDTAALAQGYLQTMRYFSLIAVPLGLGLSAVSEPFVISVLTPKWADMIPVIRLASIYMLLLSLGFNAGTVFKAVGRPGLIIKLSIIRLAILLPSLTWALLNTSSLVVVLWIQIAAVSLHLAASFYILSRILNVKINQFLEALWPAVAVGSIMYTGVLLAIRLFDDAAAWLQLLLATVTGAIIYCGLIWFWQGTQLKVGYAQLREALASRHRP